MNLNKHFFYTFESRHVNRNYGGEEFVLGVWENKGKGKFEKIGTYEGCTCSHKGFESDAWGVVLENRPKIAKFFQSLTNENFGYWRFQYETDYGVKLQCI